MILSSPQLLAIDGIQLCEWAHLIRILSLLVNFILSYKGQKLWRPSSLTHLLAQKKAPLWLLCSWKLWLRCYIDPPLTWTRQAMASKIIKFSVIGVRLLFDGLTRWANSAHTWSSNSMHFMPTSWKIIVTWEWPPAIGPSISRWTVQITQGRPTCTVELILLATWSVSVDTDRGWCNHQPTVICFYIIMFSY